MVKLHRQLRDDVLNRYRKRPDINIKKLLLVTGVFAFLLLMIVIMRPSIPEDSVDCASPPQPGMNWSHCNKQGENLSGLDLMDSRFENTRLNQADFSRSRLDNSHFSYADLSGSLLQQTSLVNAGMKGVVLRQANLQGANLTRADLSYAELEGANLEDAVISETRFDHAIWLNGETCLVGSVGSCLLPSK